MKLFVSITLALLAINTVLGAPDDRTPAESSASDQTQKKIVFIQDDAQDFMVSEVFELKYLMANDLAPFIRGIVLRNNAQSSVDRINYVAGGKQYLTVSCPTSLMPFVRDIISKVDRKENILGKNENDPIAGSGVVRGVYPAKYRSAKAMVDVMKLTGINSGVDSSLNYDPTTNMIYLKDDAASFGALMQYLGWLDRPIPTANIVFNIYEVRDSELRDLGIDYLGWKNGPGLNMFQWAFDSMSVWMDGDSSGMLPGVLDAATGATLNMLVQSISGSMSGYFFAPQFDASFIRCLQQDGRANIQNSASLTVRNGNYPYSVGFAPQFQNIIKDGTPNNTDVSDRSDVVNSTNTPLAVLVDSPKICFRAEADSNGIVSPDAANANIIFDYVVVVKNVLERNNYGDEISEETTLSSSCNLLTGEEKVIGFWSKDQEVEQYIGMPFLGEIPIIKYIFGTETKSHEVTYFFVTAKADVINPEFAMPLESGKLQIFSDIFGKKADTAVVELADNENQGE